MNLVLILDVLLGLIVLGFSYRSPYFGGAIPSGAIVLLDELNPILQKGKGLNLGFQFLIPTFAHFIPNFLLGLCVVLVRILIYSKVSILEIIFLLTIPGVFIVFYRSLRLLNDNALNDMLNDLLNDETLNNFLNDNALDMMHDLSGLQYLNLFGYVGIFVEYSIGRIIGGLFVLVFQIWMKNLV